MRINQNIMAVNARNNLSTTEARQAKSLEKLSSGFRINRAGDDAAGLVISEGLRSQVGGLKMAVRNAQDGVSVVQTAEGALTEVHSMLQRMRDLAVQAGNTGANDEAARDAAQSELNALTAEIDRIAETTKFGSVNLLDGTYGAKHSQSGTFDGSAGYAATGESFTIDWDGAGAGAAVTVSLNDATYATPEALQTELNRAFTAAGINERISASVTDGDGDGTWEVELLSDETFTSANGATETTLTDFGITAGLAAVTGSGGTFQVGANSGETISLSIGDMSAASLGTGVDALTLDTDDNIALAIDAIDSAIGEVSSQRGDLGATQNRLEHTIRNLSVTAENLTASESRIRDTDMAAEMMEFTRNQILSQAGTAMLAQANQVPQSVLSLLR